jgi:hypothetical protein
MEARVRLAHHRRFTHPPVAGQWQERLARSGCAWAQSSERVAFSPDSDSRALRDEQRDPPVAAAGAPRSPSFGPASRALQPPCRCRFATALPGEYHPRVGAILLHSAAGRQPAARSAARDRGCYLPREVFFGRLGFVDAFFTVWASDFGRFLPATSDSFPRDVSRATLPSRPRPCRGPASAGHGLTLCQSTPTC